MATPLETAIQTNAEGPRSASVDGVQTSQHSLADQIAADKHLAGRNASNQPNRCLRFLKVVPPGTV